MARLAWLDPLFKEDIFCTNLWAPEYRRIVCGPLGMTARPNPNHLLLIASVVDYRGQRKILIVLDRRLSEFNFELSGRVLRKCSQSRKT